MDTVPSGTWTESASLSQSLPSCLGHRVLLLLTSSRPQDSLVVCNELQSQHLVHTEWHTDVCIHNDMPMSEYEQTRTDTYRDGYQQHNMLVCCKLTCVMKSSPLEARLMKHQTRLHWAAVSSRSFLLSFLFSLILSFLFLFFWLHVFYFLLPHNSKRFLRTTDIAVME